MIFTVSRAFTNSSVNYAYEIKSATVKINGTISATHKIISENTTMNDNLIKLGQGSTTTANDLGLIFTRGNGTVQIKPTLV